MSVGQGVSAVGIVLTPLTCVVMRLGLGRGASVFAKLGLDKDTATADSLRLQADISLSAALPLAKPRRPANARKLQHASTILHVRKRS